MSYTVNRYGALPPNSPEQKEVGFAQQVQEGLKGFIGTQATQETLDHIKSYIQGQLRDIFKQTDYQGLDRIKLLVEVDHKDSTEFRDMFMDRSLKQLQIHGRTRKGQFGISMTKKFYVRGKNEWDYELLLLVKSC